MNVLKIIDVLFFGHLWPVIWVIILILRLLKDFWLNVSENKNKSKIKNKRKNKLKGKSANMKKKEETNSKKQTVKKENQMISNNN